MAGRCTRSRLTGTPGRIGLSLLIAAGLFAHAGAAGDRPDADALRRGRMMTLSLRIAQAEGHEGKVRKYKSLARQHRAGKSPPAAPFVSPGTRASRPGRTP